VTRTLRLHSKNSGKVPIVEYVVLLDVLFVISIISVTLITSDTKCLPDRNTAVSQIFSFIPYFIEYFTIFKNLFKLPSYPL